MNNITELDFTGALTSAAVHTFADMAFLDVLLTDSESAPNTVEYHQVVSIAILAPIPGAMHMFLPLECKKTIVENIHAKPWEELSVEEIDDCLLELLNVLAGNFLQFLLKGEGKYNISFPEILFDEKEIARHSFYKELCFDAEGIPFKLTLTMERESL